MPTTLLPPSVEAALSSQPPQPRLVSWYEWPVRAAGFGLPLAVLGTFVAGWLACGPLTCVMLAVLHVAFLGVVLRGLAIASPKELLHHAIARHGRWEAAAHWLTADWTRLPLVAALSALPAGLYGLFITSLIHAVTYHPEQAAAPYLGLVTVAAGWGLLRTNAYNRDFRARFQGFKRAMEDLEDFRSGAIWDAVQALPRHDFDGQRSRRDTPTPTALKLLAALEARGHRGADMPDPATFAPRLILEYELLGLRRGRRNYRADLAFVCPRTIVKVDVELDGGYHHTPLQRFKDGRRNQAFLARGWAVIRFENAEVDRDLAGCVREVERVLALMHRLPKAEAAQEPAIA